MSAVTSSSAVLAQCICVYSTSSPVHELFLLREVLILAECKPPTTACTSTALQPCTSMLKPPTRHQKKASFPDRHQQTERAYVAGLQIIATQPKLCKRSRQRRSLKRCRAVIEAVESRSNMRLVEPHLRIACLNIQPHSQRSSF